jgi:O-succinylbenzoic acid--CoA ligase
LGGGKVQPQLMEKLNNYRGNCYESYGATETLTHIAVRIISPNPSLFRLLDGVSITPTNDGIEINDQVTNIQVVLNDAIEFVTENEFEVLGRMDDVINSGGVKIHPLMVEELISKWTSMPFYVTQSSDVKWGSVVTLVVHESDSTQWKSLDMKAIFENHANWKPRIMIGVQKIERNENGKIIRKRNPDGLVNSL